MRIPFTSPMAAAAPTAVRIASQMRLSDCSPTPTMIMAANVNVPGVLRSMPPVMITNIWPSAVIASSAADGAIADNATGLSVSGTQIAATITSRVRARYAGTYRDATTNLVSAEEGTVMALIADPLRRRPEGPPLLRSGAGPPPRGLVRSPRRR